MSNNALIPTLDVAELNKAAALMDDLFENRAHTVLGTVTHFYDTAEHLRDLATLKKEYDAEQAELLRQWLQAERKYKEELHALTQLIADNLVKGRANVRYAQAQMLLDRFNITPK
jgi:predicted acyl esterase